MEPLSALSPSKQNIRAASVNHDAENSRKDDSPRDSSPTKVSVLTTAPMSPPESPNGNEPSRDRQSAPSSPRPISSHSNKGFSPLKVRSPVKYRLQEDMSNTSPAPDSPAESTIRFNEGLTRAIGDMHKITDMGNSALPEDEGMSTIYHSPAKTEIGDDTEFTFDLDRTIHEDGADDLSSISAIQTDMTRFANLRDSPSKKSRPEPWSPSKQLRGSMNMSTPASQGPRPLLLRSTSRTSSSPKEDNDETPRRARTSNESTTDLMNFTGITNVNVPPPESITRSQQKRTSSGRGAFPIRVNPSVAPTPSHRSQASVDRERSAGLRSSQKPQSDRTVPSTPVSSRSSMYGAPNGFGMDLLDIDLEPMATPRSIPTITPRELEALRSELQSRISGLEATLSGKEAEVMALKRSITDAEVRAGKASEDAHTERLEKEALLGQNSDMERRTHEMEDVLRELKQNAFVEEREREKLRRQAEDAEKKVEEQEVKILELNASLSTLSSERIRGSPSPQKFSEPATPGGTLDVDAAVKNATETVARELHVLYKSKHERKVSDLKVSYEKRWIKQVEQLRSDLKTAQDEILRLQAEREVSASGSLPAQIQSQSDQISKMDGQIEELRRFNEEITAGKKMLEAEFAGLKTQLDTVKRENEHLRVEVEAERAEKGELVAQVDLFLSVSADQERQEKEREREKEQEREREREREKERERERERERQQPVSPPRSENSDASSSSNHATQSPYRSHRNSVNGFSTYNNNGTSSATANGNTTPRPRPMSMLQKPTAGKFAGSGIPGLGVSGLKAPGSKIAFGNGAPRGGLMEGINRMGAGGR